MKYYCNRHVTAASTYDRPQFLKIMSSLQRKEPQVTFGILETTPEAPSRNKQLLATDKNKWDMKAVYNQCCNSTVQHSLFVL